MYLHRIELQGFKSFADRTTVQFDPGITAIVGPNGCGKSNIIDAVRWVLGEQRARLLRSEKMENVIFNGTSTRRALGMAEVSLTIHNTRGVLPTEYSEVTVGRRLYRSGESDYLLNGTTCRLKDILDLFMDTGMGAGAYSVIELKMIEDLLSENPQDRRRLFEEAAGITKYKLRRAQTLRRLDQTQSDLERLRDLTEEIDRNVRSLARQAKKAERHRELSERLESLELLLAAHDYGRLHTELQQVRAKTATLEEQLAERTAQLQMREAETEAARTELVRHEQRVAEAQRALNERTSQIRTAEAEARLAAEQLRAAEAALERLDREAAADTERGAQLSEERAELETAAAEAGEALAQAETVALERQERLSAAEQEATAARGLVRQAEDAVQRGTVALRSAEREREARRSRREILEQEHLQLQERVARAEEQHQDSLRALQQADEGQSETAARRDAAAAAVADAEDRQRRVDAELEDLRERLADARRREDAAAAEHAVIAALIESHEGFPEPVKNLLEQPDWAGTPQTVADIIGPPASLRRAVDAALGPLGDCIVVHSEAEAHAGIQRLRSGELGRATFLVIERLPQRGPQVVSPTPRGTEPLAAAIPGNGVSARLARTLLANHFLIDDLSKVAELEGSYPIARFVTPNGEWAGGGMIRSGAAERSGSAERIGRREQLEAAETTRREAAAEVEKLEAEHQRLRAKRAATGLDQLRAELATAEQRLAETARAAGVARARAEAAERDREQLGRRLGEIATQLGEAIDTTSLDEAVASGQQSIEKAEQGHAAAREALLEAEVTARQAYEQHAEARVALAAQRNRLSGLERDRDRVARAQDELEVRERSRTSEQEQLQSAREDASARQSAYHTRATELQDALGEVHQQVQQAETALLEARSAVSDAEALLRELRRLREDARDELGAAQLRQTELQARIDGLAERITTEYGREVGELERPDDDFDAPGARAELPDLHQQMRNLGAVNELALESYDEQKERLDFMLAQQRDLEQAEASLRNTIREINTTARERFEETFQAVREAFQRLFSDLFGENAAADLLLAGDDPLEDDIEIRARPKGKKPSTITQLSGGEKTLTAIALLFAIYLVKPSPFCILDEVDAPLDDSNVERFMRLIRSFSESTQFILVTHNKLTMEAADRMYGVTMQEEGVSRLVGVRFSEVLPAAA